MDCVSLFKTRIKPIFTNFTHSFKHTTYFRGGGDNVSKSVTAVGQSREHYCSAFPPQLFWTKQLLEFSLHLAEHPYYYGRKIVSLNSGWQLNKSCELLSCLCWSHFQWSCFFTDNDFHTPRILNLLKRNTN